MEQIDQINKLNHELCEEISGLEQDVESLEDYSEELKYGKSGTSDGHVRRQQKISATLQLLLSTDSPTVSSHTNYQKNVHCQVKNEKPPRPHWMSPAMYQNATTKIISFNFKNCPGCDQMFPVRPTIKCQSSFEYLVHVVEECVKYKELNLITECGECNFKFPSKKGYNIHESAFHSSKPDWMATSIFSKIRKLKGPIESVPCPGCNHELKRKVRDGIVPHF